MLSRSVQQKRLERKGVDALFSRDDERGRRGLLIGSLAILVGLALWAINVTEAQHPSYFGPSGLDPYTLLVLAPLGLLFIVSGTAVSLTLRTPTTPQHNAGPTDGSVVPPQLRPPPGQVSGASLRLGIVAFLESVLIVTLYAGVLDEYRSNLIMQDWVHRTLPTAQILLSSDALILVSGILALTVAQFLPGRAFHEKVA